MEQVSGASPVSTITLLPERHPKSYTLKGAGPSAIGSGERNPQVLAAPLKHTSLGGRGFVQGTMKVRASVTL